MFLVAIKLIKETRDLIYCPSWLTKPSCLSTITILAKTNFTWLSSQNEFRSFWKSKELFKFGAVPRKSTEVAILVSSKRTYHGKIEGRIKISWGCNVNQPHVNKNLKKKIPWG